MDGMPRKVGTIAGPLAFLAIRIYFHPPGLSMEANAVLASAVWVALWWITEAIPIAATALLPIVLFPLTGGLELQATTTSYGHRLVFLYVGGFFLAIAIEKWHLHRRIALNIIRLLGTDSRRIILGFMLATAGLSMWISNTATSVMMLPIALAIIAQLQGPREEAETSSSPFAKALMLSIAYSASIGGMATLIGTPPNLVLAGVVEDTYGVEITFLRWFIFGLPISLTLLALCWCYLCYAAFRLPPMELAGGVQRIEEQLSRLGPIGGEERRVLIVFGLAAFAWTTRSLLQQIPGLDRLDDTIIAMTAGLSLFLIPACSSGVRLLEWDDSQRLPWGIILLFGGGMALAQGFTSSGLAIWMGTQMTLLQGVALILLVLCLTAAVNFLTEITSNLATTSMLLPILAPMAVSVDVHPFLLMVGATVAASCAFMLPVATPPNAVVFGSGCLRIPDMMRTGLWMNLLSVLIITGAVYFLLPWLWGFDPHVHPAGW